MAINRKEYMKKYREEHKEHLKEYNKNYQKKWYQKNKEYNRQQCKKYRQEHKEQIKKYRKIHKKYWKQYYEQHRDYLLRYSKKHFDRYIKTEAGKKAHSRHLSKRRGLGHNELFPSILDSSETITQHHVNDNDIVWIPEDLHYLYYVGRDTQKHRDDLLPIIEQLYPEITLLGL